jgi:flagellar motor switch protein FliN/FliY
MVTPDDFESNNSSNRLNPEETEELLKAMDGNNNSHSKKTEIPRELEFLYDVPLQVSVEVGRTRILLKDLLAMGEGYVVELDKLSGEPLDLYINSRLIAKGEAVKVGDKFGIRLTEVISQSDRIEHLG